jgi:hypothetical protein
LRPVSSRLRRPDAIALTGAGIATIPMRFQDFVAGNRYQKLLSHFGEAGTAIFAVNQVEYAGHD